MSSAAQQGLVCWRPLYAENCVVHSASYFLFPFHSLLGFSSMQGMQRAFHLGAVPTRGSSHMRSLWLEPWSFFLSSSLWAKAIEERSERQDRVQTQTHEKEHMGCNKLNATQQGKGAGSQERRGIKHRSNRAKPESGGVCLAAEVSGNRGIACWRRN